MVMQPLAPDPPHEQMLTAGAGCWAFVPCSPPCPVPHPLSSRLRHRCKPSDEQMLIGVGQVQSLSPLPLPCPWHHSPSPLSPSPHSGGGWYHPPFPLPILCLLLSNPPYSQCWCSWAWVCAGLLSVLVMPGKGGESVVVGV